MADPTTLRGWLETFEADQLQVLLEHNRHVVARVRVRDLEELARRLEYPSMVVQSLLTSPAPLLQLVETASALGAGATVPVLRGLLDSGGASASTHATNVEHWLAAAAARALLWVDGERIYLNSGLDRIIIGPLGLSRPARLLLTEANVTHLRHMLRAWQRPAPARRADLLAVVWEVLGDQRTLRQIAAGAPDEVFSALHTHISDRLADSSPVTISDPQAGDSEPKRPAFHRWFLHTEVEMWQWAEAAGLLFDKPFPYGVGEFPSELYLALAPPDFRTAFDSQPPALTTTAVSAEQVERSSAAAVGQFLGTAMAILEGLSQRGLRPLRSGGIGARELSRYAKQIGTEVTTVRLVLALAAECGLLGYDSTAHIGTSAKFDTWRRQPPARRTVDLVQVWLTQDLAPSLQRDAEGSYLPLLTNGPKTSGMPAGYVLCQIMTDYAGRGAISGDEVVTLLNWHHPMAQAAPGSRECTWAEAHQLGVLADGALSPFAAALADGRETEAIEDLTRMLPEESRQVLFGSDLTVMVPGSPDPQVVDLLDVLAVREGHGVANSWRISAASVREALDAGYVVDDLLTALGRVAGRDLPQALEYLLRDVGRRHGHLSVRGAGAVITCEDQSLLAEVVASRSLTSLTLSLLAPTVASAVAGPEQTISALRKAGYLPVEVDDGGAPVVQLRRPAGVFSSREQPDAAGEGEAKQGDPGSADAASPDSIEEPMGKIDDAELQAFLDELRATAPQQGHRAPAPDQGHRAQTPEPESPAQMAQRLLGGGH